MDLVSAGDVKNNLLKRHKRVWEEKHEQEQRKLTKDYRLYGYAIIPALLLLIAGVVETHPTDSMALLIFGGILILVPIVQRSRIKRKLIPESTDEDLLRRATLDEFLFEYETLINNSNMDYKKSGLEDGGFMYMYQNDIAVIPASMSRILTIKMDSIREVILESRGDVSIEGNSLKSTIAGAAIGGLVLGEAGLVAGAVAGSNKATENNINNLSKSFGQNNRVTIYTRIPEIPSISILLAKDNDARDVYGLISARLETT